jgi:hypothetical protein
MTESEFFDILCESLAVTFVMDEIFQQHNLPFVYDSLETMLPLLPEEDRLKVEELNEQYLSLMTKLCATKPRF